MNNRHFIFDGCDTVALAQKYGTPLYVMSQTYIQERCAEIRQDFLDKHPNTKAVFASKAFQTLEMCRMIKEEGLGLDVVSGGELFTALKAGTDPQKIVFHGNNKSAEECEAALRNGVGTIVADSYSELLLLNEIAGQLGQKAPVLLRYMPAVDSHTHRYISTGHEDSKFGFSRRALLVERVLEKALAMPNVHVKGFHFHVGSQLTENDSHLLAIDSLTGFLREANETFGLIPEELNLGGGFGIKYLGDP